MRNLLLLITLFLCSCVNKESSNLTGCWIEVLPPDVSYIQGMNLESDGTAESVGMSTLKYRKWDVSDNRLILQGESIGNGQSVQFLDTLKIIKLEHDTLSVEIRDRQIAYVRQSLTDSLSMGEHRRQAYEGFEWRELSGAGLRLMAQRNDKIRLIADPSLPGIVMVREGDAAPHKEIQIFDLPNKDINDVIKFLEKTDDWDKSQTCKFKEVKVDRRGVHRYMLVPDGDYAVQTEQTMKTEPVPATCNGWGVGNSGSRYFEVHENNPDKALFIEVGQDAPLFDENSIAFVKDDSIPDDSKDILYTLSGVLCIGHEVRSFKPEGSEDEYWFVDKTGRLCDLYDNITKGNKNGKPVKVTLKLEYNGKWDDGFAEDYSGVYFVREIVDMKLK